MKNAGMAGAVALVGIGLLSIGLSNFANRAEAVPSAVVNAGPDEPTIVAYQIVDESYGRVAAYRVWSDNRIERRVLGRPAQSNDCELNSQGQCEWIEIAPPPGGDGFACRTDINGDRTVNAADLGLLIAQWGEGVSCDPQPTYPCFDLGNLSIAAAK
ncbi:hypothetical protein OAR33_00290 [bacterium]|nr:hypothetical protein [bacterium]